MFSFYASGNRPETVRSLRAIQDTLLGGDPLGILIRDSLAAAIEGGAEPLGRYVVRCSGNGQSDYGPITLSVVVTTEGLGASDIHAQGGLRLPLKLDDPSLPTLDDLQRLERRTEPRELLSPYPDKAAPGDTPVPPA